MPDDPKKQQRILVVLPNWVGDAVMATPTLRALRQLYPDAHIAGLTRRYVKSIFAGLPFLDRLLSYRTGRTSARAGKGQTVRLAARLRSAHFDLAVVLPNSFRSALLCKLAKIRRIVGYDRDGRGFLLSDRLLANRDRGRFIPTPLVRTYMGIASYLGAGGRDLRMELAVTPRERDQAIRVLASAGLDPSVQRPGAGPLVMLNPGAQYGQAKCWPAEHFAQLANLLHDRVRATILLSGSPRERPILDAVQRHARHPLIDLAAHGLALGPLKEIVRHCDLLITNDTGPRHIAAAFGVPVVTIFGPTHPEWTEINFPRERKVAIKVVCGPCQKKKCPLDHRCMTRLTPAMVCDAAAELLDKSAPVAAGA